jgi:predicted secreted protein
MNSPYPTTHSHHYGTKRVLMVIASLVIIGVIMYVILAYGGHSNSHSAIATSSPVATFPIASSTPATTPEGMVGSGGTSASGATSSPISSTSAQTTTHPPANSGSITITNADNNTTITLAKGQDFTVQLGNDLRWTLTFDPSASVAKLSSITNQDAQGTYEATSPGTITLKGSGAPICTPEEACPQFEAVFTVTLEVQ